MKQYHIRLHTFLLFVSFICISIGSMNAQNKPLDLGDYTTMAKGKLQNETYFSYVSDVEEKQEGIYSLFRYGLKKNYELQFGWNGSNRNLINNTVTDQNASIGIKAYLLKNTKYQPGLGVVASVNLTTNRQHIDYAPSINVLYDKSIGSFLSVNGNYQITIDTHEDVSFYNYSVNLESVVTNWLDIYVGYIGTKSYGDDDDNPEYNKYVELGALLWVKSGLRLYPFYDVALDEGTPGIMNLAVLISL